jgi:hypothetical protein
MHIWLFNSVVEVGRVGTTFGLACVKRGESCAGISGPRIALARHVRGRFWTSHGGHESLFQRPGIFALEQNVVFFFLILFFLLVLNFSDVFIVIFYYNNNKRGNLNGYSGPLPVAWMQQQFQLQKRILERMVELGLRPVLPGFSGFVPPAMQAAYPHAKISKTRGWYGFEPTFALSPTDPLYGDIHRAFLQRQRKAYEIELDATVKDGDAPTFFSIDPYNEVRPHTNDPEELGQISLAIYETLREVEGKNAVWVMQGWLFVHQADFWRRYCLMSVLQSYR